MLYSGVSLDISPKVPTFLGCGNGGLVPKSPDSGIEANIILFEENRGMVLLVSIDALYVGPRLRAFLEIFLKDFFEPHNIFLAATHSHNAPMLDPTKPLLGLVSDTHLDRVAQEIAASALQLVSKNREDVSLRIREYAVTSVVGRRKILPLIVRKWRVYLFQSHFLPDVDTCKDVVAQFVEIWSSEKLVGALWVYPCHPVGYPFEADVSADYVGEIRLLIRDEIGSGIKIPVVVLQGSSGDLRPPAYREDLGPLSRATRKILGPRFGRFSEQKYTEWVNCVWQELVQGRLGKGPAGVFSGEEPALQTQRKVVSLDQIYFSQFSSARELSVHFLRIGQLEIVGISAEPTWDFFRQIRETWTEKPGFLRTLVGCIDDTYGYLPSKSQIKQGGYEVEGFQAPFSLKPNTCMNPSEVVAGLIVSTIPEGPCLRGL